MFNFPTSIPKRISLLLLAGFFILAGTNHFLSTDFYMSMMPPYLPAHLELVYMSGLLEILGGITVLFAKTRRWAGYGLIALMLAVFPANIYMAMNPALFAESTPLWALYLRLPIQFIIIGWIYWTTKPAKA
ncbi:MAG: hypothetical protein R6X34_01930 [Chloroflexota bacterium]